ncbi:methyltransferase domain-containing protein [Longispora albida]|uniref:methyltransferase domain-containing protein n=1 Tax=Longispora albida TaxID=203523 RepID=UPI0003AA3394|nr:methyltransferase domain-containing protein [Longispora albida]
MILGGLAGKQRLDALHCAYQAATLTLLAAAGVRRGARCLDLGCGGGHATRELAQAVGPLGSVTGIDIDAEILELARRDTRHQHNVEYRVGDANDLPEGAYDVVYARLLLSHLPGRGEVLARMAAAAVPGGLVIVEDLDWDGAFCYPPHPAFDRYWEIHAQLHERRGGDPRTGPKLPALMREAGLADVRLSLAHPAHLEGTGKLVHALTWRNISAAALSEGLTTAGEVLEIGRALAALTEDPAVILALPRTFQVWGRRPAPRVPRQYVAR